MARFSTTSKDRNKYHTSTTQNKEPSAMKTAGAAIGSGASIGLGQGIGVGIGHSIGQRIFGGTNVQNNQEQNIEENKNNDEMCSELFKYLDNPKMIDIYKKYCGQFKN
jgi:hypothetical protein